MKTKWEVKENMNIVIILRNVLAAATTLYAVYFFWCVFKYKDELTKGNWIKLSVMSFVCGFFDALGIGNFATLTSCYKLTGTCQDDKIPGTLNAGITVPTAIAACLFLSTSDIDGLTCVTMILSSMIGAVLGAKIVCKMNLKAIRYGMGMALLVLAAVMACRNLSIGPFGSIGTATGLGGVRLMIGIIVNFFLGALMMIGIGLYAPCMALVGALGMDITMAFPIMMGSCTALMITGGITFIRENKYDKKAALTGAVAGSLGVTTAYLFVSGISVETLIWCVIVVMIVTSSMFLRDARKMK